MERTFAALSAYMQKAKASVFVPGRTARYLVPDAMAAGMHILMTSDLESMDVDEEITGEAEYDAIDDELEVENRNDLTVE